MTGDIVLDLPVPPSVNRTRRVDWRSMARRRKWESAADTLALRGTYSGGLVLTPHGEQVARQLACPTSQAEAV
jgi:hypothetical protein